MWERRYSNVSGSETWSQTSHADLWMSTLLGGLQLWLKADQSASVTSRIHLIALLSVAPDNYISAPTPFWISTVSRFKWTPVAWCLLQLVFCSEWLSRKPTLVCVSSSFYSLQLAESLGTTGPSLAVQRHIFWLWKYTSPLYALECVSSFLRKYLLSICCMPAN